MEINIILGKLFAFYGFFVLLSDKKIIKNNLLSDMLSSPYAKLGSYSAGRCANSSISRQMCHKQMFTFNYMKQMKQTNGN